MCRCSAMNYDLAVPTELKRTQQWFASIITRPIDTQSKMMPVSPQGRPMTEEAANYISPSPTLQPDQRIQIYNQQYWWRLLANMHDIYPILTRLFGYHEFNLKFAIPYLAENQPDHWSLNHLGDRFPNWVEKNYQETDKELVTNAVKVDYAFNASFTAPQGTLDCEDGTDLTDKQLKLQPHVFLFEFPYEIFKFREEFLAQEPDYWIDNDFPKLEFAPLGENFHYIFYRNKHLYLQAEKVSQAEYLALKYFENQTSINNFCDWLENQPQESILVQEAEQKLHLWLQNWTARQLLGGS